MIDIGVNGLDQLLPKIASLPREMQEQITEAVGEYALETVKAQVPPQKNVSRADAYPEVGGWFSDKQRRWYFANNTPGVPYARTGQTVAAWKLDYSGGQAVLSNDAPGAPFVFGFAAQSRHERMVGWQNINYLVGAYLTFKNARFRAAVKSAMQQAFRNVRIG